MEHFFDSREQASRAAAERIAADVSRRLAAQGNASLVVSGGKTPAQCFGFLAEADLAWSDVYIVLSDERWVPPEHADSNEGFVRSSLLVGRAAAAHLEPMYQPDTNPAARCEQFELRLKTLPFPFASVLLGMGEDGHFASLFPDLEDLGQSLDAENGELCVPVSPPGSPYARVSLTLTAMSRSDEIMLLIFGEEKRRTYERARDSHPGLPVAALLRQKRAPVHVYWAP